MALNIRRGSRGPVASPGGYYVRKMWNGSSGAYWTSYDRGIVRRCLQRPSASQPHQARSSPHVVLVPFSPIDHDHDRRRVRTGMVWVEDRFAYVLEDIPDQPLVEFDRPRSEEKNQGLYLTDRLV